MFSPSPLRGNSEAGMRSYYDFGDRKEGDFGVTANFSLLHLISSTLSTAKFNTSMVYLRYLRESFGGRSGGYYNTSQMYYPIPDNLNLGGTPLNEAVICGDGNRSDVSEEK